MSPDAVPVTPAIILIYTCSGSPATNGLIFQGIITVLMGQGPDQVSKYLTAPLARSDMPGGIPYIIGNEAAERFSFYGMRAILVVFMTQYLVDSSGTLQAMSEEEAKGWYHLFVSAVYFTPLLGALLSDGLLGKYRTIILLSLFYCAGHAALALDDTRWGLVVGLGLIALGAGGIKPCVSSHLGDQFGRTNQGLLSRAFAWFYFAINLGGVFFKPGHAVVAGALWPCRGLRRARYSDADCNPDIPGGTPQVCAYTTRWSAVPERSLQSPGAGYAGQTNCCVCICGRVLVVV